jgi:thiol:disulfide interchange protein DsbA
VETSNFDKRLSSFSMKSAINSANNKMEAMGIDSVPTIVVNDKYRVSSSKGFEHMLQVVEFLVEKEKKEANN